MTVVPDAVVTVRDIDPGDFPVVGALLHEAYRDFENTSDDYRAYVADPAQWVEAAHWVRVAERHGRIVGVVAFALRGDGLHEGVDPPMGDADFRFLAVTETLRGQRIGERLVSQCIAAARSAGCHRIAIYTMDFMHGAHRLYERMGFVRRPDLDVRFHSGDGLVYTFDLTVDAEELFGSSGPVPDVLPWFEDVLVAGPDHDSAGLGDGRLDPTPVC